MKWGEAQDTIWLVSHVYSKVLDGFSLARLAAEAGPSGCAFPAAARRGIGGERSATAGSVTACRPHDGGANGSETTAGAARDRTAPWTPALDPRLERSRASGSLLDPPPETTATGPRRCRHPSEGSQSSRKQIRGSRESHLDLGERGVDTPPARSTRSPAGGRGRRMEVAVVRAGGRGAVFPYALARAGCRIEFSTARADLGRVWRKRFGRVRTSSRRSESAGRRLDGPHRGSEGHDEGGPPPRANEPQPAPGAGHLPKGQCPQTNSADSRASRPKTTLGSTRTSRVEPSCRWPSIVEGGAAQEVVPSAPWPPVAPVAGSPPGRRAGRCVAASARVRVDLLAGVGIDVQRLGVPRVGLADQLLLEVDRREERFAQADSIDVLHRRAAVRRREVALQGGVQDLDDDLAGRLVQGVLRRLDVVVGHLPLRPGMQRLGEAIGEVAEDPDLALNADGLRVSGQVAFQMIGEHGLERAEHDLEGLTRDGLDAVREDGRQELARLGRDVVVAFRTPVHDGVQAAERAGDLLFQRQRVAAAGIGHELLEDARAGAEHRCRRAPPRRALRGPTHSAMARAHRRGPGLRASTGRKRHVTIRASRGHEPSPRGRRRAIRRLARIDELRARHGRASRSGAARPLSRTRQRRHHPRNGRTRPGEILLASHRSGGVAEWSKAAVLKTAVLERAPGVRIPSPPLPPAARGRSHC